MSISHETISRAILGDPAAIEECSEQNHILPCKHCGQNYGAVIHTVDGDYYVAHGTECAYESLYEGSEEEAIADWNWRSDIRAVAKELYAPKWIACNERLPTEDVKIIVVCKKTQKNKPVKQELRIAVLRNNAYTTQFGIVSKENVTHWMPIPEPPEVSE